MAIILLAALLRLNGIKAQHITCLPYEDPFEDCHVVVDCLLPSGKRIMLDPTWRLYLKDKEGNYVSLSHLRELLLADEPIFENQTADYNGTGFAKEYHRNYMIKTPSVLLVAPWIKRVLMDVQKLQDILNWFHKAIRLKTSPRRKKLILFITILSFGKYESRINTGGY